MKKLLVIHGPNLNMLGLREPGLYGSENLDSINASIEAEAKRHACAVDIFQSNTEGDIVERIQGSIGNTDCIIINPAAYTHTSVAIRDALLAVSMPVIEVHLSNIHKREEFRKKSLVADIALGQISGFGAMGYRLAVQAASEYLDRDAQGRPAACKSQ